MKSRLFTVLINSCVSRQWSCYLSCLWT